MSKTVTITGLEGPIVYESDLSNGNNLACLLFEALKATDPREAYNAARCARMELSLIRGLDKPPKGYESTEAMVDEALDAALWDYHQSIGEA